MIKDNDKGYPCLDRVDLSTLDREDWVDLSPPHSTIELDVEPEAVVHPSHYRADSGIEAIDAIEAWDLNFNLGNVIKYIARCGLKDPNKATEDLKKAAFYLQREIDRLDES